jgi:O-antigen/teichoic acid export membrane protein
VLIFGDDVMRILYGRAEFVAPGATLGILALAAMAFAIGLPAGNALAAMERPRAIVVAASIGTIFTVGLVWWLLHARGLPGAAIGMLVGNTVGSLGLWVGFLSLVSRPRDRASAPWMLRPLTRTTDPACN